MHEQNSLVYEPLERGPPYSKGLEMRLGLEELHFLVVTASSDCVIH